ncbi:MAG: hypothetical protein IKW35_01915 [Paludibacteraceae bacterium]|nr:hypothetical protein [Paludibacteraceae bacterium]
MYILSTSPFNASTGLVLIRRWLPFRKTPRNAQSTNNGGVSGETFRRWLRTDAAFLRANHITPKTKILPPHVVKYLCEKYDIEVECER